MDAEFADAVLGAELPLAYAPCPIALYDLSTVLVGNSARTAFDEAKSNPMLSIFAASDPFEIFGSIVALAPVDMVDGWLAFCVYVESYADEAMDYMCALPPADVYPDSQISGRNSVPFEYEAGLHIPNASFAGHFVEVRTVNGSPLFHPYCPMSAHVGSTASRT